MLKYILFPSLFVLQASSSFAQIIIHTPAYCPHQAAIRGLAEHNLNNLLMGDNFHITFNKNNHTHLFYRTNMRESFENENKSNNYIVNSIDADLSPKWYHSYKNPCSYSIQAPKSTYLYIVTFGEEN